VKARPWTDSSLKDVPQNSVYIQKILPEYLTESMLGTVIWPDLDTIWYWSDDWDPSFYVALVHAGFITICTDNPQLGYVLLAQMHDATAVLDWQNLHCPRSLRRELVSGLCERMGLTLRLTTSLSSTLDALERCWAAESWLHPPYRRLMEVLATGSSSAGPSFLPVGVELRAAGCDVPVAGELGYVTGGVYTSLSGFMHPDRRRWNNTGKIQLLALGRLLMSLGFDFWNLGQPQMQYKQDLGAQVTPRHEFIPRWVHSCSRQVPSGFIDILDRELPCADTLMYGILGKTVRSTACRQ